MAEEDITGFARAQDARHLTDPDRPRQAGISVGDIARYARRPAGAPDALGIERFLRENPGAMAFYKARIEKTALASSPVALAASGTYAARRVLGPHVLRLAREISGIYLVLEMTTPGDSPYEIEARREDGLGVRVGVGVAVGDVISMRLDPRFPELEMLAKLIEDPKSSLWLLRVRGDQ